MPSFDFRTTQTPLNTGLPPEVMQLLAQAIQKKNQMYQGLGQDLGQGITTGIQGYQQGQQQKKLKQQQAQFDQARQQFAQQNPNIAGAAQFLTPQNVAQLLPGLEKQMGGPKPIQWKEESGRQTPEGYQLFYNPSDPTQEKVGTIKAKSTSYGATMAPIRQNQLIEQTANDMIDRINPYFQSGPGKEQAQRLDTISRIEPLIQQMNSQVDSGDTRQMRETATTLNRIIQGATGTEGQIEGLIPNTAKGKYANWIEYFTNAPKGAGQKEFVKRYADSVAREKNAVMQRVNMQIQRRAPTATVLKRIDPDTYDAILQNTLKEFAQQSEPNQQSPSPLNQGAGKATLRWNPQTGDLEPVQ
jgi:hypothetical protein